ncbi:hypothetical protein ACX3YD_13340 [Pseudomonas fluorescens group sp. PF-1]
MIIKLSPDGNIGLDLSVIKAGEVLNINGEDFDFSPMASGDTLPVSAITSTWFRGDVEKLEDGSLVITLALPNGPNASPEQRFPVDLVSVPDGPVVFPAPLPPEQVIPEEIQ